MNEFSKVPDEIAQIVVSHDSYADDKVIYPALRWLRDNVPLGLADIDGYDPLWMVSKHADIMLISQETNTFNSSANNVFLQSRAADAFTRSVSNGRIRSMTSIAFFDAPEHGMYRGLTANWFMKGRVAKLEEQIIPIAQASVKEFLDRNGECDFVKDFSSYYPLRVIMRFLGAPKEDEAILLKLTKQLFGAADPEERNVSSDEDAASPEAIARAWRRTLDEMRHYFKDISRERRRHPKDDLISLIANAKIDDAYIDEEVEFDYYVSLATAGHDTTSHASAAGMLGLIRFPGELEKVRDNPALVPKFVDESVRWAVPVKHFMRTASADAEVRGQPIRAGDRLMLCYPSGNRDEDAFDAPDQFRADRTPNRHLGFGYGPHTCLGRNLALLDMRILFENLLPYLKSDELSDEPQYVKTNLIGGLKSLPIRYELN